MIIKKYDKSSKDKKTNSKPKNTKTDSKNIWQKVAYWLGMLVCVGVMVASVASVAMSMYLVKVTENDDQLLNLTNLKLSFTSIVYYQDIETQEYLPYQSLDGNENRIWVDLDKIPQHVIDAYIAVEDKDFYEHKGVDLVSTIAAMINEYTPIKLFSSKRGASTITQQLVKNLTNDNAGGGLDGALRKVREIFRAFMLEKRYTKEEILEAYLNTLRLSNNWAGVQAGANNYFGKDVSELTVSEAASLAGITKNPSAYNPYTNYENNISRRNDILYFMREQGKIDEETYQAALAEELVLTSEDNTNKGTVNSYFTDMVIDQVVKDLMAEYDMTKGEAESYLYNGGLKIYSTVNPTLQAAMEEQLKNVDVFPQIETTITGSDGTTTTVTPQAAMVSVDYNGGVAGVVGGFGDKTQDRVLNRAVDSVRQTGSTMKPIGSYALALDYKYINYSTGIYDDYVKLIPDPKDPSTEIEWPRNYSRTYTKEQVPVVTAIAKSLNTVAVRVLEYVTPEVAYEFVKETLHVSSLVSPNDVDYAPMALGSMTNGISPLEMAAAYAIFGNGGKYIQPYCYTSVEDSSGQVILETKVTSVQAISEETAYIMNRALKQVLATGGTGAGLAPSRLDAVGKTGTTSDDKDHWFIGVTPYYSTAVWWGYDQPTELQWKRYSAHPPTTAWRNVMNVAQKDLASKSFPTSSKVVTMTYCTTSGDLATELCPGQAQGYYTEDNVPGVCITHR